MSGPHPGDDERAGLPLPADQGPSTAPSAPGAAPDGNTTAGAADSTDGDSTDTDATGTAPWERRDRMAITREASDGPPRAAASPPSPPADTSDSPASPSLPADHPDRAFAPEAASEKAAPAPPPRSPSLLDELPTEPAGAHSVGPLPASASLSPAERVIPSWTDPTVRRASDLIGGPLGRHAQVGRNRILTPLRVCLLMAIAVLIFGWLFKSPCIQQGGDGAQPSLDQSGQRPWMTGCYNDIVPLYGSRGFDRPRDFPYANSFIELTDGGQRRIYPREIVHTSGGSLVADTGKGVITLSDNDIVGDAETGYSEVRNGRMTPVADIDALGQVRYLEYPVLTGLFQWGVSWANHGYLTLATDTGIVPVPLDVASYFTIGALLLGLFYLWAVVCTARLSRRRVWDTAIMCLSPLLIVHAFTNWDLLAVGLCAGGMLAWGRRRPVLSGVLLGLGMAAKLYPILLLGPLLVLCLRVGRMGAWLKAFIAAGVVWAIVNVPVMLEYPHAWYEFFRLNSERPPEWDSWYFLFANITGSSIWDAAPGADTPSLLNTVSLVLFLAGCAAIGWLALAAERRPRFAQLAFLVVATFLLTNKVWSPQYSIWLVPLVALALPRWRPVLIWQFSEVAVWMLLMFQFAGVDNKGLSVHPFVAAAILRGALLIMLMVMVIRDIQRPERDLVRRTGDDDPSGGVLEDLPDRFTLPSLPDLLRRARRRPRAEAEGPAADEAIGSDGAAEAADADGDPQRTRREFAAGPGWPGA